MKRGVRSIFPVGEISDQGLIRFESPGTFWKTGIPLKLTSAP